MMESLTWCCSRKVFIVSSFLAMACFTLTNNETKLTFASKCIQQTQTFFCQIAPSKVSLSGIHLLLSGREKRSN